MEIYEVERVIESLTAARALALDATRARGVAVRAPDSVFRPIHYLGNKSRLVDPIEAAVAESAPAGRVVDLFSGSGVVAARLANRYEVLAVDIQEYARVLSSVLLDRRTLPSDLIARLVSAAAKEDGTFPSAGAIRDLTTLESEAFQDLESADNREFASALLEHGSIEAWELGVRSGHASLDLLLECAAGQLPRHPNNVITRFYGGVYFSYAQAAALDRLAGAIRHLPETYRETALAVLLSTASEVVSSVGNQFAQPLRPRDRNGIVKLGSLRAARRQRALPVHQVFERWSQAYNQMPPSLHGGRAVRMDYRIALRCLPPDTALVYADPPYTRDHYSRYYHILETLALGDVPQLSMVRNDGTLRPSRGLYRHARHQSPFCIKSQAPDAFRGLFEPLASRGIPLVLSYSPYASETAARPRLLTIDSLLSIAAESFGTVEVKHPGPITHSKLNAERLNTTASRDGELLIVCRK